MASEVALDESCRFTCGLTFSDAAGDVVAGGGVVMASVERSSSPPQNRSASSVGASAQTWPRISCSSSAASRVAAWMRRVQPVVFATESALTARDATDLEHALSARMEVAAKTGAVAASPFDRPGASARRVMISDPKERSVTVRIRRRCPPGDNRARGRRDNRQDVLVTMGVDAEHVVQLVCKHQTRSSDLCS